MYTLVVSGKVVERADLAQAVGAAVLARERLQVEVSREPGMAVDLAEAAGRAGALRVVAVGGDGTIHEVADGLLRLPKGERPVLGIVPCGTANDFAAQFD